MGEFKTKTNKHSHVEWILDSLYCNWENSKLVETEVLHEGEIKEGRIFYVLQYMYTIANLYDNVHYRKIVQNEFIE